MMKSKNALILIACFLTFAFSVAAQKDEKSVKGKNSDGYKELLSKLQAGDTNIDFKALRIEGVVTP